MTLLFSEDFASVTPGAALTTSNTAFDSISPVAPIGSNADAITGSLSMRVNPSTADAASGRAFITETDAGLLRLYVKLAALPPSNLNLVFAQLTNTTQASIRVNTDGTLSVRNGNIATWTGATALPVGGWARINWNLNAVAATQNISIYTASDGNSTTPAEESGPRAYDSGNIDEYAIGSCTGVAGVDFLIDAIALDDTTAPGPAVTPPPAGVETYLAVAEGWKSLRTGAIIGTSPPTPTAMKYGVSASPSPFADTYAEQVAILHANCVYFYGPPGHHVTWSDVASVPDDHDIWLQTKETTKADYVATLATFPPSRTGKVYLHYHNEPEDQIEDGAFSLATWQQRCDWLFEAIDEAGLPYVHKSVELMFWTLQQNNNGNFGDTDARRISNYIRPGLEQLGISAYANEDIQNGHTVSKNGPTFKPQTVGAYMDTLPGVGLSIITGFALTDAYVDDATSQQNRVQWFEEASSNFAANGAQHYMWFDTQWPEAGDYRIAVDGLLMASWRDRLIQIGQW